MRVALVLDDFFPASGGIGRSVQTQIEELVALGHDVTLLAPDRFLEKPRVCRVVECPSYYLDGLPAHLNILRFGERVARRISSSHHFDVVHSQTDRGAVVLAARIARLQGIAHVHSFHANVAGTHQTVRAAVLGTLLYQMLINPVLTNASRRVPARSVLVDRTRESGGVAARMDWASFADIAGKVDLFTVPSPFMRDLINEAAQRELPSAVVPTGVNRGMLEAISSARRERSDNRVRFLSVGRLAKEKRLDVLVKAFRLADAPGAELVIVGDGDQRDRLRGLARGCDAIDFRGHLNSISAIAYEMVNADAMVLSSYRFDSQALVIGEAVAAGLPVLYCDDRLSVGLSKDSAFLSEPDIGSLAAGIRRLCDPVLRSRLAAGTRQVLPCVLPSRTGQLYVEAYQEAMRVRAAGDG